MRLAKGELLTMFTSLILALIRSFSSGVLFAPSWDARSRFFIKMRTITRQAKANFSLIVDA